MNAPNAKTAAAARKQAPVVADNVIADIYGKPAVSHYDGYGSCPRNDIDGFLCDTVASQVIHDSFAMLNLRERKTLAFRSGTTPILDTGQDAGGCFLSISKV